MIPAPAPGQPYNPSRTLPSSSRRLARIAFGAVAAIRSSLDLRISCTFFITDGMAITMRCSGFFRFQSATSSRASCTISLSPSKMPRAHFARISCARRA